MLVALLGLSILSCSSTSPALDTASPYCCSNSWTSSYQSAASPSTQQAMVDVARALRPSSALSISFLSASSLLISTSSALLLLVNWAFASALSFFVVSGILASVTESLSYSYYYNVVLVLLPRRDYYTTTITSITTILCYQMLRCDLVPQLTIVRQTTKTQKLL